MQLLEGSQQALERLTADTMERVAQGQQELLGRHEQLRTAQSSIQSHVAGNLRELGRVRSAISVGQAGVAHTLAEIRAGLERAGQQLSRQEEARNRSHQQLSADLELIHHSALQLLHQLESVDVTTRAVVGRFDALLGSLGRMNGTIVALLSTLDDTQRQLDRKLGWLVDVLGGDLHRVTAMLMHVGYLLLGMLLLVFLQAAYVVRLALLLVVPANLLSLLQYGPHLQFSAVTTLLVTVGVGHQLVAWLYRLYRRKAVDRKPPLELRSPWAPEMTTNATQPADLSRLSTRDVNSSDSELETEPEAAGPTRADSLDSLSGFRVPLRPEMTRPSPLRRRLLTPRPELRTPPSSGRESPLGSPRGGSNGTLARSGLLPSPGERPWCAASCRSGLPCRNPAGPLSPYCGLHARHSRQGTPVAGDGVRG
ncbi:protein brambleberry-like [Pollicipes pollicipes]|uniref:protein brambleberry-like n=1 Tax=Pollicipes pollicipes TaxID=41117 RepID=UPI001884A473|nr:protein brambleberry-like [Pollicipes pollicipes]